MNFSKNLFFFIISSSIAIFLYQNCGSSFEASGNGIGSFTSFSSIKCDLSQQPSDTPLKRLTKVEFLNSVRDLLEKGQAFELAAQVLGSANLVPTDNLGDFTNMDDTISQGHVNGYYQIASQVRNYFERNSVVFSSFINSYANCTQNNETCLRNFITEFGLRAFRRPLQPAEVERYVRVLDPSARQSFSEIVFVFLQSPQFLFHIETEGSGLAGNENALQLSPYELVSRLSFALVSTTPDDTLLNMAANGSILSESGKEQALNHILNNRTAEVQATFKDFYSQWLKTRSFASFQFNPSSTKYDAFLAGATPRIEDMISEVDDLMNYYTFESSGSIHDLLTSPFSFARSTELANIYGVSSWDGDYQNLQRLPANERSGLLTRAFFMVSPNDESHPIHRSVFIRRQLLCETIAPPPDTLPADALLPPEHDPSLTTRQRFEQKTSSSSCMGCHSVINPVGFAFEAYDGIGRYRQFERVFEDDGRFTELPLDTQVEPKIDFQSSQQVNGPIELTQLMADSGKVDACFAKQLWRYTHKRRERPQDNCSVLDMAQTSAREGGGLLETLKKVISTDTFTRRYWGNEE